MNVVLNRRFHNANRLHTEIASWIRRILAELPDDKDKPCPDPNVVRKAVAKNLHDSESGRDAAIFLQLRDTFPGLSSKGEQAKSASKIEFSLSGLFTLIPSLVLLAGAILIGRAIFAYIACN
jgi:hypothetical protein